MDVRHVVAAADSRRNKPVPRLIRWAARMLQRRPVQTQPVIEVD